MNSILALQHQTAYKGNGTPYVKDHVETEEGKAYH